jgi:hypothetical protein
MARGIFIPCLIGVMIVGTAARADLVTNGNFSAGPPTPGDPVGNGWSNSDGSIVIDSNPNYTPPYNSDAYDASFTGTGTLSQTLATAAGTDYTLSFSLLSESGLPIDFFTVQIGTFSMTITGDAASSYQQESFTVPGADLSGGDTLSFVAGDYVFGDPFLPWNLDDVSVTAQSPAPVPEPGSMALLLSTLGLGGLTLLRARRTVPRPR